MVRLLFCAIDIQLKFHSSCSKPVTWYINTYPCNLCICWLVYKHNVSFFMLKKKTFRCTVCCKCASTVLFGGTLRSFSHHTNYTRSIKYSTLLSEFVPRLHCNHFNNLFLKDTQCVCLNALCFNFMNIREHLLLRQLWCAP